MQKNGYVELFKKYFSVNLKSVMIYDKDYVFGIIAMFLKTFVNFCILLLIFEIVDEINGWGFYEILFLFGLTTVSFGLWHCFFIDTVTIPFYVKTGEFDRFLLKPIDPLFQIMMESFDEDGWGQLFFGIIVIVISILHLKISVSLAFLIPVFCIAGMLIYASISILISSIAFFTVGSIDLTDNVADFQEISKYPLTIFNNIFRIVFTIVIPIGFTSFYPSLIFLDFNIRNMILSFLCIPVSIIFFFIAWKFWHFALRKYSSCGA